MSTETCSFGWFDGDNGHVCHETGEHEHKCRYCKKKHDPTLVLVPGPMGGFIKTHKRAK